jgi:opacity protein-like surface antigen
MPVQRLLVLVSIVLLPGWMASSASAEPSNENYIGPTVTFGGGQTIVGIGGKFKITDNLSLRPSYSFANLAGAGVTVVGGSATYDMDLHSDQVQPFVGVGVNFYTVNNTSQVNSSTAAFAQAGIDLKASSSVAITGDVKVPLAANAPLGTVVTFGGGYRF